MTRGISSPITNIVSAVLLLYGMSTALAGELYQWNDKDGTITYSTTPPPPEITTKFEEISKSLDSKPSVQAAAPEDIAEKPPMAKQTTLPVEKPIQKPESRLERMVRLSPEPREQVEPKMKESVLQPVNQDKVRRQRKCRDLKNRVTALESRLHNVSSADELNQSMLLLTKYQDSFDRHCPQ